MSDLFPISKTTGLSIAHVFATQISRSRSGERQSLTLEGGYWSIKLDMAVQKRSVHDKIAAFINKQRGRHNTFRIIIPHYSYTKTGFTGNVRVNGASQSGSQINVFGMPSNTLVLKAGDYIRFTNHKKVYEVNSDLNSDGAGEGVLSVTPNVVSTPVDSEEIVFNDVDFTVANAKDTNYKNLDVHRLSGWELEFEEVWN